MLSPTAQKSRNTQNTQKRRTLYRIGELAQKAGVTARTIRYYEELGILSTPRRPQARHRRYSQKDLLHLQRVQQLKEYGLTLGEIREIFALSRQDPSGEKSRLRLLTRYREKLREAMKRRERIEAYVGDLEWHIDQLERVGNFQACPGEECRSCRYTGICKFYNDNHRKEEPQ
jgi:MerR family copper efflux transcriptional regulator